MLYIGAAIIIVLVLILSINASRKSSIEAIEKRRHLRDTAIEEGRAAARRGAPEADCPYFDGRDPGQVALGGKIGASEIFPSEVFEGPRYWWLAAFRQESRERQHRTSVKGGPVLLAADSDARSSSTTLDLDAEPKLPFPLARVESHQRGGIVEIENRPDGLYIASRRVLLHNSEKQVVGIQGHELQIDLKGEAVLNVNALHFLIENQDFIPSDEEWRRDKQGNVVMIYFWGTVFRHPSGDLGVVYMKWDGTTWDWFCSSIANYWLTNKPAAILATIHSYYG